MRGKALKNYGTVAALVIIIGIFGLLRPASFFTLKNFLNIIRQAAPLAMVALGATFVMTAASLASVPAAKFNAER